MCSVKLLHTADWHVGRTIRGQSRAAEHAAVLRELAGLARTHDVDAVLVCGDVFDTAAPAPESEQLVYRALLDLAADGRTVVVIAGNHDSDRRLQAVAPLLDLGSVITRAVFADAATSVVEIPSRDGDELALVATVPFLSQRWIVKAAELMSGGAAQAVQLYEHRYKMLVEMLTERFRGDTVNVIAAHAFVHGAEVTGSERAAHLTTAYGVPSTVFPANAHYVALGHLHRPQAIPGPCPVRYCGSPLQLDFGEAGERKVAVVVEATAGVPARVEEVPLTAGRGLRVVKGSLAELREVEVDPEAYLRVVVREKLRVGLADEVRELFPGAVDVVLEGSGRDAATAAVPSAAQRSPHELFAAYLAENDVDDDRLVALFADVYEEVSA